MQLDLELIRQRRKDKKITLEKMATSLGYKSATGYYYVESGRCNFKPNHIPIIAEKLELGIDELFSSSNIAKMAK